MNLQPPRKGIPPIDHQNYPRISWLNPSQYRASSQATSLVEDPWPILSNYCVSQGDWSNSAQNRRQNYKCNPQACVSGGQIAGEKRERSRQDQEKHQQLEKRRQRDDRHGLDKCHPAGAATVRGCQNNQAVLGFAEREEMQQPIRMQARISRANLIRGCPIPVSLSWGITCITTHLAGKMA